MVRADREERLRRLALQDEAFVEAALAMRLDNAASGLDPKTHALVRLGALVAVGAPPVSFQCNVDAALAAGASDDEIVGALIAVAPVVGFAKVISATPKVAVSMGYDLDTALEVLNGDPH